MTSNRGLRAALIVGPAFMLGLACTAILKPRDNVQRCGSTTDCEDSGDNRYDVVCRFPEGSTLDSDDVDKVCVAAFKEQSCDPNFVAMGNMNDPLLVAFEAASLRGYTCVEEEFNSAGCPPADGVTCPDGLENVSGFCLPPGEGAVSITASPELEAQDVLDQFCRQFFCDETFVCLRDTFTCVQCDDDDDFGQGGCGTVYAHGGPSCIYSDECDGPDANPNEPNFGTCT